MTTELKPLDLDNLVLYEGQHVPDDERLCVIEARNRLMGRAHSDRSSDEDSAVVDAFLRSWNDAMNDDDRQQLKALLPLMQGIVVTPELEIQRSWMAMDWYCRVSTPSWLRLAGLTVEAESV